MTKFRLNFILNFNHLNIPGQKYNSVDILICIYILLFTATHLTNKRFKMRESDRGYANTFSSHWVSHSCEMDTWTVELLLQNVPTAWQRLGILACVQCKLSTVAEGGDWSWPTAWHILSVAPWLFAGSTPLATSCDMGFWRLSLQFALRKTNRSVCSKMCKGFWFVCLFCFYWWPRSN